MATEASRITLYQPVVYQIRVPGLLTDDWSDSFSGLKTTVSERDGQAITTLIGSMDQAALQGLLRCLYGLGLPILAVSINDDGATLSPSPSERAQ